MSEILSNVGINSIKSQFLTLQRPETNNHVFLQPCLVFTPLSDTAIMRKDFPWISHWKFYVWFFVCLGIWEYIEQTRDIVHDLEKRVRQAKNNVETMNSLMNKWSESPLYERKDGKKELLLNIEVFKRCISHHWYPWWIVTDISHTLYLIVLNMFSRYVHMQSISMVKAGLN